MTATYKTLFSFLCICSIFLTACTDEDNMEWNKGSQPLFLQADQSEIVLDVASPESDAVTFDWTTGSNQGTNAAITYVFELGLKGSDFENALSLDLGRDILMKSFKVEELNDLLLNNFNQLTGEETELEARVTANIDHPDIAPEVSEIVTVKATTYQPLTKTLYLLGDATPNGWDADNATELNKITGVAGGFTWTGNLTAGSFKMITTLGQFVPSYNKGADDTQLYLRESFDDPYDEQFTITEGGTYKITLNLITLTFHIEKTEGPEYSQLWFVGHSTGWSFEPMTADPLDPFLFHYNKDISEGGEFKIGTAANSWDAEFFRPETNGAGLEGTNVVKWAGDPDNKWDIPAGVYKITLDTRSMKIEIKEFTPYPMIYLVGDASPNAWDIGNATAMTAGSDPYQFTWTGTLTTGELKFTCDKQSDWNGDWFIAPEPDMSPTGQEQQMLFNSPGAGVDYKWKITEAGTYAVVLDQLRETVIIQKQ
jgi:hypothetical protein